MVRDFKNLAPFTANFLKCFYNNGTLCIKGLMYPWCSLTELKNNLEVETSKYMPRGISVHDYKIKG